MVVKKLIMTMPSCDSTAAGLLFISMKEGEALSPGTADVSRMVDNFIHMRMRSSVDRDHQELPRFIYISWWR